MVAVRIKNTLQNKRNVMMMLWVLYTCQSAKPVDHLEDDGMVQTRKKKCATIGRTDIKTENVDSLFVQRPAFNEAAV